MRRLNVVLGILKNTDKKFVQYISREDYLYSKII